MTNDEDDTYNSAFMPKISIRNKLFRLDLVTPKLINCMNDSEKENYITICRQLYSEIYDTWFIKITKKLFVKIDFVKKIDTK